MDVEQLHQIAHGSMAHRKTHAAREQRFIFHHGRRTAQIALRLADHLEGSVDRDILYAGALFHDVGHGNERHNEAGARMARELLSDSFTPEELDKICEVIALHNDRKRPNRYSIEVQIVQDADILDHVGPISPWLSFHWSAVHQRTIDGTLEYLRGEHQRERAGMRSALNLDASIDLFDQRVEFERRFYGEFERVHKEGL